MTLPAFSDYTENVSEISFSINKGIPEKLKEHEAELLPSSEVG
jgi:hypothetical protein